MDALLPGLSAAANLHPLFAAFPPALWLTAAVLTGVGAARRHRTALRAGAWITHAATVAAWAASFSGLWAAWRLGTELPQRAAVLAHRDWMLAASSLSLVASASFVFYQGRRRGAARWVPPLLVLLTAVVGVLGADRGAVLVYRHGVGTTIGGTAHTPLGGPGEGAAASPQRDVGPPGAAPPEGIAPADGGAPAPEQRLQPRR